MVLVDTSVWIDFFQYPESTHSKKLEWLIKDHNRVIICGIILQEILQGIRDEKSFRSAKNRLSRLPFVYTDKNTYFYASSIYRRLRKKGITIPPVDITIAAIAKLNKYPLFTKDDHFGVIANHLGLKLYN